MTKEARWGVIGADGISDRRTVPGMMLYDRIMFPKERRTK